LEPLEAGGGDPTKNRFQSKRYSLETKNQRISVGVKGVMIGICDSGFLHISVGAK